MICLRSKSRKRLGFQRGLAGSQTSGFLSRLELISMSKPRKKPNSRFHAFIVEPSPDFKPNNWQQTPKHYRIVSYVGPKDFRGPADAWKFLYNHDALRRGDQTRWAICLDFEGSFLIQRGSEQKAPQHKTDSLETASQASGSISRLPDCYQTPKNAAQRL